MALSQEQEAAVLLLAERGDVDDLLDAIRARAASPETSDFLVTGQAIITLRIENMTEEDAAPLFMEEAQRVGLVRRLVEAVDDTGFYVVMDISDTEVEEVTF